jgi:ABC-type glycerol-3-phosphate transport system substrate-binding protein
MRKITKTLTWCTAMLILALTLSACGARDTGGQESPSTGAPASESAGQAGETEFLSGMFNGLADGHTIEIETENGPQAFQISEELFKKAETWEPGVKVKYKAEGLTITEIDLE